MKGRSEAGSIERRCRPFLGSVTLVSGISGESRDGSSLWTSWLVSGRVALFFDVGRQRQIVSTNLSFCLNGDSLGIGYLSMTKPSDGVWQICLTHRCNFGFEENDSYAF